MFDSHAMIRKNKPSALLLKARTTNKPSKKTKLLLENFIDSGKKKKGARLITTAPKRGSKGNNC